MTDAIDAIIELVPDELKGLVRQRLVLLERDATQRERDRFLWLLDGLPEKPTAKEIDELRGAIWKGTSRLFE